MLGGGSPAEPCRAATVKLFPCRAWDKAQNYTDQQGEDNLSLARTTRRGSSPPARALGRQAGPRCPCTHKTIGPALLQARLCQEFCSPSVARACGAAHVF